MITHTVPATVGKEELSRYLKRAWPLLPGFVLKDILKKKDVRINGVKSGKGDFVRGKYELEIYGDAKYFEPRADILFDDEKLVVCVKPQGLPSLPDRDGIGADTMETRLKRQYPNVRLCHRLDAGTGGVMFAAVDDTVYAQAFDTFKAHSIRKTYRAILLHKPSRTDMVLKAYLVKDPKHSEVTVLKSPRKDAKEIVTRVHVCGSAGDGMVYAELEPVTGRTHQLRAHMAFIGCPILGDDKYGNREANKQFGFVNRLCLWCETMELPDNAIMEEYAGKRFQAPAPQWR